jgi:ATP phosphoribosyltransferase
VYKHLEHTSENCVVRNERNKEKEKENVWTEIKKKRKRKVKADITAAFSANCQKKHIQQIQG